MLSTCTCTCACARVWRRLAVGARFGVGHSQQKIDMPAKELNTITIANSTFAYGSSAWHKGIEQSPMDGTTFQLNGETQTVTSAEALGVGATGEMTIGWEGKAIVARCVPHTHTHTHTHARMSHCDTPRHAGPRSTPRPII